jgi:hypothetical protein
MDGAAGRDARGVSVRREATARRDPRAGGQVVELPARRGRRPRLLAPGHRRHLAEQQAETLSTYNDETLLRQARLLHGMIRDQVRLSCLEQELAGLSGQLANTYEELSLIYQISGGMRINRRASDFFKGACLDVMSVMNVRGMGVSLLDNAQQTEPVLYGSLSLPPGKVHRLAGELMRLLANAKAPCSSTTCTATSTSRGSASMPSS